MEILETVRIFWTKRRTAHLCSGYHALPQRPMPRIGRSKHDQGRHQRRERTPNPRYVVIPVAHEYASACVGTQRRAERVGHHKQPHRFAEVRDAMARHSGPPLPAALRRFRRSIRCLDLYGVERYCQSSTWSPSIRWNSPTFDVTTTKPFASAVPAMRTS